MPLLWLLVLLVLLLLLLPLLPRTPVAAGLHGVPRARAPWGLRLWLWLELWWWRWWRWWCRWRCGRAGSGCSIDVPCGATRGDEQMKPGVAADAKAAPSTLPPLLLLRTAPSCSWDMQSAAKDWTGREKEPVGQAQKTENQKTEKRTQKVDGLFGCGWVQNVGDATNGVRCGKREGRTDVSTFFQLFLWQRWGSQEKGMEVLCCFMGDMPSQNCERTSKKYKGEKAKGKQ